MHSMQRRCYAAILVEGGGVLCLFVVAVGPSILGAKRFGRYKVQFKKRLQAVCVEMVPRQVKQGYEPWEGE